MNKEEFSKYLLELNFIREEPNNRVYNSGDIRVVINSGSSTIFIAGAASSYIRFVKDSVNITYNFKRQNSIMWDNINMKVDSINSFITMLDQVGIKKFNAINRKQKLDKI